MMQAEINIIPPQTKKIHPGEPERICVGLYIPNRPKMIF
jgi:hypothetical protein